MLHDSVKSNSEPKSPVEVITWGEIQEQIRYSIEDRRRRIQEIEQTIAAVRGLVGRRSLERLEDTLINCMAALEKNKQGLRWAEEEERRNGPVLWQRRT